MSWEHMAPENTEFVMVCFEGPDPYAMAGGLGMRVDDLSRTLAEMGFPTHGRSPAQTRRAQGDEPARCGQGGRLLRHKQCSPWWEHVRLCTGSEARREMETVMK
jgi:hypothetical protein